jgi:hypothetical protein
MIPRFTTMTKRKLFEQLRDRADRGDRCPSLRLIARISRLDSEAKAEQLLQALQTDGVIRVLRGGLYPWIEVLRNTYTGDLIKAVPLDPEKWGCTKLVPSEPVTNEIAMGGHLRAAPDSPLQATAVDALHATLPSPDIVSVDAQPPTPSPATRMPERRSSETVEKKPRMPKAAAIVDQGTKPATSPAQVKEPERVQDVEAVQPTKRIRPSRAVDPSQWKRNRPSEYPRPHSGKLHSVKIDDATYRQLKADAAKAKVPMLAVLRRRLAQADCPSPSAPEPTGKPHIKAAVMRAWQNDGRPFGDFMTALIDLGLAEYLDFRAGLK